MRLDINLATHVYEDARRFWLRWGTGVALLGIVTLGLLGLTISGWLNARLDHQKMNELRTQIAERDRERMAAEALLNRPENRAMRERSQYLNELIARKTFSWTQAIEGLEKVMPPRVHLVSIQPQLNEDNQLSIKMVVAGDSTERAIELVKRMEESRHFRETRIEAQTQMSQAGADSVQTQIGALYVPSGEQGAVRKMPDLREKRKKLKIAIGVMVGVSVVSVGVLVSPLVGSTESRQQQLNQLRAQLTTKNRQVEPLRGLDKKIPLAMQQIDDFYKTRFSAHDSDVAETLGNLSKVTGVKIETAKYKADDPEPVGLRRVEIEASIKGDYQPLMKFLNGLERSKVFFIVNSIGLATQNGPIQLEMKLETYQKVGS